MVLLDHGVYMMFGVENSFANALGAVDHLESLITIDSNRGCSIPLRYASWGL